MPCLGSPCPHKGPYKWREPESSNGLCYVYFCVADSGSSSVKPEVWKLHVKLSSSAGKSQVEAPSLESPQQQLQVHFTEVMLITAELGFPHDDCVVCPWHKADWHIFRNSSFFSILVTSAEINPECIHSTLR